MPNPVGGVPDFTNQGSMEDLEALYEKETAGVTEEVKEDTAQTVEEKETPASLPEEKIEDTKVEEKTADEIEELRKANEGLRNEIVKKHKEIAELRGQKREVRETEPLVIQTQASDDLKDLHPNDVGLIDRILKARGLMTKEEFQRQSYEQVKNEELNKFLDKYPEYKPENDPLDQNWTALQKEFSLYKMPADPRQLSFILERAHGVIGKTATAPSKSKQVEVARMGGGGGNKSVSRSSKQFTSDQRLLFEKGGWSDKEIEEMEKGL